MIFGKVFFVVSCAAAGITGMNLMYMYQEPYPVRVNKRHMLTPVVAPEDDAQIGLEVFRDKNCPIRVMRRIKWADGSTTPMFQELDKDFGPTGPDDYTLRVPLPPKAPHGKAEIWSRACSRCNSLQELSRHLEACSPESVDRFIIGDHTVRIEDPHGFEPQREASAPTRN